jgi:hypothetical protein
LKLPLLWAKAPLAKPAPTSIPNTILMSFFIMLSPFPQKCFSNPQPVDPKLALKLPLLRANDGPAASANKTAPPTYRGWPSHPPIPPLLLPFDDVRLCIVNQLRTVPERTTSCNSNLRSSNQLYYSSIYLQCTS